MLDDVQRQAFEAAMRVAGELGTLGGDLGFSRWFTPPGPEPDSERPGRSTDTRPPVDVGRLRSDVVRAAETFSDLMRALLDVGFDAMDELARRPSARPCSTAPPGGTARIECVVRNERRERVAGVRPRVHQLVSDDGLPLDATSVVEPTLLDLEPHERVTVLVDVAVPAGARPGRYHGLVLASGLPDVAHAVTVEVTPPAGSGDDDG
jgi:hypothetical protein